MGVKDTPIFVTRAKALFCVAHCGAAVQRSVFCTVQCTHEVRVEQAARARFACILLGARHPKWRIFGTHGPSVTKIVL